MKMQEIALKLTEFLGPAPDSWGETHPALWMALSLLRESHRRPLEREALRRAGELYWEERRGRIPSAVDAYTREWSGRLETKVWMNRYFLGLWRLTKGAYLFNKDVFEELIHTPLKRVPREALERLPEPSPLILLPEPLPQDPRYVDKAWGFHISLVRTGEGVPEVLGIEWITLEAQNGRFLGVRSWGLKLEGEDLEEAWQRHVRLLAKKAGIPEPSPEETEEEYLELRAKLNLALYLCQERPDFGGVEPRPPAEPRKTRRGPQIFPPEEALVIPTGWRWGKALRLAREAEREARKGEGGGGRSPAPHIRRAHWHLYWTGEGSRKDPTRAVPRIRWVPATLVGRGILEALGLGLDDLPATVRPVEEREKGDGKDHERRVSE